MKKTLHRKALTIVAVIFSLALMVACSGGSKAAGTKNTAQTGKSKTEEASNNMSKKLLGKLPKLLLGLDSKVGATYKNNLTVPNSWEDYGEGDPFVMRFNGRYYLYVSTRDIVKNPTEDGIKCWSSNNLTKWKYEGLVAGKDASGAFAPEVIYYNGKFYLYSSLKGNGHYVFESDKPTGPFERKTDNQGKSIDGSVFIEDDGSLYFYSADDSGIRAGLMKDPLTLSSEALLGNTSMNGWTEGPMVIKRNGLYYLSYCGNHVLSPSYRIGYSVSDKSPIEDYIAPIQNPLLLSVKKDFNGVGHSSTVMGPDLDSYYIFYHNLAGRSQEGMPLRHMNMDRLLFNGKVMTVNGPTNFEMPIPKGPDYEVRPDEKGVMIKDGDNLISNKKSNKYLTAEFNFTLSGRSLKSVFAYKDSKNYFCVNTDAQSRSIELVRVSKGKSEILEKKSITQGIAFNKLITLRVAAGSGIQVFLNGMEKISKDFKGEFSGSIGYISPGDTKLSFTAFSNKYNGSSDFEVPKLLPGIIQGPQYLEGKGLSYFGHGGDNPIRNGDKAGIKLDKDSGSYVVEMKKGDFAVYKVLVQQDGLYALAFNLGPGTTKDAAIGIAVDSGKTMYVQPGDVEQFQGLYGKNTVGEFILTKGIHYITVSVGKGTVKYQYFEAYKSFGNAHSYENPLNNYNTKAWEYFGNWKIRNNAHYAPTMDNLEAYLGHEGFTDYQIQVDISLDNDIMVNDAGLVVRMTERSNNNAFSDKGTFQQSFKGYFIGVVNEQITLYRCNYGTEVINLARIDWKKGEYHTLKTICKGSRIQVFVDQEPEPVIDYIDNNAFMHGKIGLYSHAAGAYFKNIKISSIN